VEVSSFHLGAYVDEEVFRLNERGDDDGGASAACCAKSRSPDHLRHVRNQGKLPATNVSRKFEFLSMPSSDPLHLIKPPPPPTRPLTGGRILPSGGTAEYRLEGKDFQFNKALGAYWLVVRFSYTDAIDSVGESAYCWRFRQESSDDVLIWNLEAFPSPLPGFTVS
jgi:hypothetical protein